MLTEPVFGLGSQAFNNAPGSVSSLRCHRLSGNGNRGVGEGRPRCFEAY